MGSQSDFTQHSIQENFPVFQEVLIACNSTLSFPFVIINLFFYSYEKCLGVFLELTLFFIGSACHETWSGGPYVLILGGCRCPLLHWYTWQWNTENLGAQNIIGRQFQVKEKVSFHAGCLEGHLWWDLQVWGQALVGAALWVSSPHTFEVQALPLLPQGMMFCCHFCAEGQGSWAGLVSLSPLSLECSGPWSPAEPCS